MKNTYPIPTSPPAYVSHEVIKKKSPRRLYALLDTFFLATGLILTFWFAGLLLLSGLSFSWTSIIPLIAFWLMVAYLALPAVHQVLTTLYLPDYFMARTKTGDGLLGDPVNLAVLGSEDDIHAAMRRAGWVRADDITFRTSFGIVISSITRQSYAAAPVSTLFLFGHRQNFAYQQEVDGNASQRHHVRFWRVPDGWRLPGGEHVEWLAAGTYDKSVGLSTMTFQITHKIDANIDAERDYIINTVRYHDPECPVHVIEQFSTAFHDRNGGGDAVQTDGNMPVLDVTGARRRADDAGVQVDQADELHLPSSELLNTELPPKAFNFVGVFLAAQLVASLLLLLVTVSTTGSETSGAEPMSAIVGGLIVTLVEIGLFVLTLRRSGWARLSFLIVVSIAAFTQLLLLSIGETSGFEAYADVGLRVLVVLAFSSTAVREWVFSISRRGGDKPIGY